MIGFHALQLDGVSQQSVELHALTRQSQAESQGEGAVPRQHQPARSVRAHPSGTHKAGSLSIRCSPPGGENGGNAKLRRCICQRTSVWTGRIRAGWAVDNGKSPSIYLCAQPASLSARRISPVEIPPFKAIRSGFLFHPGTRSRNGMRRATGLPFRMMMKEARLSRN